MTYKAQEGADDICPLCGKPIKDDEEWTLVNGMFQHVICIRKQSSRKARP